MKDYEKRKINLGRSSGCRGEAGVMQRGLDLLCFGMTNQRLWYHVSG